jgi:hypothetical protein
MLLQTAGSMLDLPYNALITAAIFMQRFYAKHSYTAFKTEHIVSTCMYLASKLEEVPRRISDVVNVVHRLQHAPDARPTPGAIQRLLGSEDLVVVPGASNDRKLDSPKLNSLDPNEKIELPAVLTGKAYYQAKEQLILYEQLVLRAVDFQVDVVQPQKYIFLYCRTLRSSQALTQLACGALNDCILYTDLCLRYPPEVLAGGALNFAVLLLEVAHEMPSEWWILLNLEMKVMENIGNELVDMYSKVPAHLVLEEGELEL